MRSPAADIIEITRTGRISNPAQTLFDFRPPPRPLARRDLRARRASLSSLRAAIDVARTLRFGRRSRGC